MEDKNSIESPSVFQPISGDDTGITEISSMCPNPRCQEEGTTRLLLVEIPFFREVIVSSFSCPHCFCSNSEVQPAGIIQEKGCRHTLKVVKNKDLNRQVVTSESATVQIAEVDLEIPGNTRKGTLSTIEGIITRTVEGLQQEQPIRKALYPEDSEKIENFIEKLNTLLKNPSFTLVIDDPAGNSFVENVNAPSDDPNLKLEFYKRTLEQNKMLGLVADDATEVPDNTIQLPETTEELNLNEEVMHFPTNCSSCNAINKTKMKVVKIPYFKEVIIMATDCEKCGHKTNEVKTAGGFEPKGKRITLQVKCIEDLSRDILKSTTCGLQIPELDLETQSLACSGKFTTVEGMIQDLREMIVTSNPFGKGDSAKTGKIVNVAERLDNYAAGNENFTLILDDPGNCSFVQNIYHPEVDPRLTEEEYERTDEQNEDLGLKDMKVENY
uniref:Zinc finger protein ZPR1 n=1 Tax=Phallusia mammillata TaxID=59560 RepID=A0A6F9DY19_9ASCI|nr:zinc finger protein ZPR1 [Phallusia mammillata]